MYFVPYNIQVALYQHPLRGCQAGFSTDTIVSLTQGMVHLRQGPPRTQLYYSQGIIHLLKIFLRMCCGSGGLSKLILLSALFSITLFTLILLSLLLFVGSCLFVVGSVVWPFLLLLFRFFLGFGSLRARVLWDTCFTVAHFCAVLRNHCGLRSALTFFRPVQLTERV